MARAPYAWTLLEWLTTQDAERLAGYVADALDLQTATRLNYAMHDPRRLQEERNALRGRMLAEAEPETREAQRMSERGTVEQVARVLRRRRRGR